MNLHSAQPQAITLLFGDFTAQQQMFTFPYAHLTSFIICRLLCMPSCYIFTLDILENLSNQTTRKMFCSNFRQQSTHSTYSPTVLHSDPYLPLPHHYPLCPPQCFHPRGQRPLPAGATGGFIPADPCRLSSGLAPTQPVLGRLRRQIHLRGLGGRHQEARPRQH